MGKIIIEIGYQTPEYIEHVLLGSSTSYYILDYSFSNLSYLYADDGHLIIKRYKLL